MKNKYPYLRDSSFLKKIDSLKVKEQYVRITVLTFDEKPIKEIQGRVISGTLNLDGSSSIRRTCNLNMVAEDAENDLTNVNNLLSINKKVELEIGFLNTTEYYTDYKYIWFPQGVFVITNPSISHSLDNVSISLQLKDKMCLLNGECGGVIPASTTFHEYDTIDENGQYVTSNPTIYQIIQELVNHFGGEQLGKIIISDVDNRIKKVMKWMGNTPLYLITRTAGSVTQYTATTDATEAAAAQTYQTFDYGDDIGYIYTDFTYPGELIGDVGSTVCDILDQIKDTLGNYEYFYDVDGNFVFQEIKNYLNTSHATVELDKLQQSDYLVDYSKGKAEYIFDDNVQFTALSNAPQYEMIKNDFVVWGVRKDNEDHSFPIRYHLAIDKKPIVGNIYNVFFYTDPEDNLVKGKCPLVFNSASEFPLVGQAEVFYMDAATSTVYTWNGTNKQYIPVSIGLTPVTAADWRSELYYQGSTSDPLAIDSNYYYTELKNEWPKLYDLQNNKFKEETLKYPTDIDFYLDIIDSTAAISEISVSNIGRRSKVVVDDSINCVFEPEIPDLIILNTSAENLPGLRAECEAQGQDYIQVDDSIFSLITGGGKFNSAYNIVRELLYQYTSYNESINITSMPIYYLEPNIRITVRDIKSGIYGDYMINSISLPLDVTGTMTISCTKALERI